VAVVIDIADAVVARLNNATLSQTIAAERHYVPVYGKQEDNADEFADLLVTVVPRSLLMVILSRGSDDFDYIIDIGIQKRISGAGVEVANSSVDIFMNLVEEIVDLFRSQRLFGYTAALCVGVENAPIYAPDHLDAHRIFTSVVSLTFRVARNR
jgi:hypothetical protein